MALIQELTTILWKNLIIRKRHWILTITEIFIPILLFLLLTYGRSQIPELTKIHVDAKYHDPEPELFIYGEFTTDDVNLWYTPYSNFTFQIVEKVQQQFQIPGESVKHFSSEKELLQQNAGDDNSIIIAIIFDEKNPNHLKYDLRIYEKYLMWETSKLFPPGSDALNLISSSMYKRRFAALQLAIDKAFIEIAQKVNHLEITFSLQEFPYPPEDTDFGMTTLLMNFMPLITILSFIFLCSSVLKRVIEEKTCGIKEYMKMVGMKPWMMYVGWILYAFISNLISIIVIVVLMKKSLWGVKFPLIEKTDGTLIFVFLLLYCLAAVALCFFIASFWNNPSIGMLFGVIFWILSYFVPYYINLKYDNYSKCFKMLLGLFPNMGLYYGFSAMHLYETRNIGLQWNNFFNSANDGDKDVTMLNIFVIFIMELFIFTLLANYIDNVKPGEYGIAKPIGYPIINFIKKLNRKTKQSVDHSALHETEKGLLNIEKGEGKVACIEITYLNKRYGPTNAVDDLSWTIYKDQITILLGQNGAGKTTTMSMLTGMIDATSGTILVNRKNLKENIDEIRQNMGLCPQDNLLFPDLTVFEHLKFFSMLKGRNCAEAAKEANDTLIKIGLHDKSNSLANTLSGGMKRKLCLCMALMGDPKVLILDEPTSGMDPETRDKICNILLEIRKSKTILISTHHMDDAEVLGDWIAVMADGKLQCYGTPMYLKDAYNTGYHLSVTTSPEKYKVDTLHNLQLNEYLKEQSDKSLVFEFYSVSQAQDVYNKFSQMYYIEVDQTKVIVDLNLERDLEKCILGYLPCAKKLAPIGMTQIYLLRTVNKEEYLKLLKCVEKRFQSSKFSLSITTLDNVLESVRKETTDYDGIQAREEDTLPKTINNSFRFSALLRKRFYFLHRKWYLYAPAVVALFSCFLFAILLARGSTQSIGFDGPTLKLVLNPYGTTTVFYNSDDFDLNIKKMTEIYVKLVKEQLGQPIMVQNVTDVILQNGTKNIAFYKSNLVVATEFLEGKQTDSSIHVNALYSSIALHSIPISINLAMNSVLKSLVGENYEISTSITPLKLASGDYSPAELSIGQIAILWIIFIPLGMLMFTSCFVIFPYFEISTNFLEIQNMAGVGSAHYWLINIIFDLCISLVCVGFISTIFWVFEGATLAGYGVLLLILIAYCVYSLPFVYAMSFSKTVTSGISRIVTVGMLVGLVPTVVVAVMEQSGMEVYEYWGEILKYILLVLAPPFSITYIIVKFTQTCVKNYNWKVMLPSKREYLCKTTYSQHPCCLETCNQFNNYLDGEYGIGKELIVSFVTILIFFVVVEWKQILKMIVKFVKRFRETDGTEPTRENHQASNLSVKDLAKSNRVKNVTFEVKENECFGLLGVNGAGKTTTFKMLTKKESKDNGEVKIKSLEGVKDLNDDEYLENFGYCPQIDSLNYALSGHELIVVMAMLRGFSFSDAERVADSFINLFDLVKYRNKPCKTYSGGNKRKLSTCLAFVSSPKVILLDEPTSGVDPVSRHKFWDVLKGFKRCEKKKSSFILCSHSMDECEALCDRIAIMKEGKIEAKGTLPDLKNEYAKGYKIQLKLKKSEGGGQSPGIDCVDGNIESVQSPGIDCVDGNVESVHDRNEIQNLKEQFEEIFGKEKCILKDEHSGQLYYQITEIVSLSKTFEDMETLKNQYSCIEDYTITDNTLKDILIFIANSNTNKIKPK